MALDRTNITPDDDDGTGEQGTIADADFMELVYDAIDDAIAVVPATLTDDGVLYGNGTAAIGATAVGTAGQVLTSNGSGNPPTFEDASGGGTFTEQTTTATGAQNNFDLDARLTFLRCTGSAPAFSGFTVDGSAPQAGDTVLIQCLGTTAQVTTQGAGSTDVHRAICASTAGQIVGVNGLIKGVYDGTTDRWRVSVIETGLPVAIAHAGGNFTGGNSQTWTVESGDQVRLAYVQRGNVITLFYTIETSTVGGTPDPVLAITIPFTVDGDAWAVNGFTLDNNVAKTGVVRAVNNAATLRFYIDNTLGSNWAASTNQTSLRGSHTFTVD